MSKSNRRLFIKQSTVLCAGCIASMSIYRGYASTSTSGDEIPDPKKLNYCGYSCPEDCKMLKATLENNTELKKEAYQLWKIKDKYGVEFEADKIFCYKCKTKDKPDGIVVKNCPVKACAIEKGYDCCIECKDLKNCKKGLWSQFKEFHETVIKMQKRYMDSNT